MDRFFFIGTSHQLVDPSRLAVLPRAHELEESLKELKAHGLSTGFIVLSTCNRVELYLQAADAESVDELRDALLLVFAEVPVVEMRAFEAVRHLIRVAGSLESMVLGENQILGQVKSAWKHSREQEFSTTLLDEIFRQALTGAREIRNRTGLGTRPVSVASIASRQLATWLAARSEGGRCRPRIALIGAGQMVQKAAPALAELLDPEFIFVNRSIEKAEELRSKHGGTVMPLSRFLADPPSIDAALVGVRSEEALLTCDVVRRLMAARNDREPLALVDVGVPPGIAPEVAEWAGIRLIHMDRIGELSRMHSQQRRADAEDAAPIADEQTRLLEERLSLRGLGLSEIRQAHVDLAEQEAEELLTKEFRHLEQGDRERFRRKLVDLAKAHAHLHLEDLKRGTLGEGRTGAPKKRRHKKVAVAR